jgi:hypothetical protein
MSERFAIYYAPPATSELWQRASRWLGRDAATGPVSNDGIAGIAAETLTAITPSATRYGFHATLKAPFPLNAGKSREELEAGGAECAADRFRRQDRRRVRCLPGADVRCRTRAAPEE